MQPTLSRSEALHARDLFGSTEPSLLTRPIRSLDDKWKLLPAFLRTSSIVRQHIESFDHFLSHTLRTILVANRRVATDAQPDWYLEYDRLYVGEPMLRVNQVEQKLTPQECRLRDLTYAAPIYADIRYSTGSGIASGSGGGGGGGG